LRTGVKWRGLGKTRLRAPHHRQTLTNNSLGSEDNCLAVRIWPRLLVTVEMGELDTKKGPAHVMCRAAISLICLYLLLPFSAELANAFKAYLPVRQAYVNTDAGALFFNRRKLRIDRRRVGLIVKHYLSLVTTQRKKSPHVLRHTFASAMLNNGADLEAIKELLGHESVATTEVYTHTTFADLKKQYKLAHPRA
jgi:site-specific recombinase XerD